MSFLESTVKGTIPVGKDVGAGAIGVGKVAPTADGQALVSDSTLAEGVRFAPYSELLDPRNVFRFSMFHNVGVTGGG